VRFTWAVALPFFVAWTLLGSAWIWDVTQHTPGCVPNTEQLYFAAFWLLLCYAWILIHCGVGGVAWVLERRVRRAERDLREVEDEDVRSRWGEVSQLSGYRALSGGNSGAEARGLSPTEIQSLACETFTCGGGECSHDECSICLCTFERGDVVRRLPSCGHTFHRPCIDLWLLRRADCPLCKREAGRAAVVCSV